jgi:hypothetical protein
MKFASSFFLMDGDLGGGFWDVAGGFEHFSVGFCGFGVGELQGPRAVRRLRSIRSHPTTLFDPTGKVLLDWFLAFAARSARLMCGFFLVILIEGLVGACRQEEA